MIFALTALAGLYFLGYFDHTSLINESSVDKSKFPLNTVIVHEEDISSLSERRPESLMQRKSE